MKNETFSSKKEGGRNQWKKSVKEKKSIKLNTRKGIENIVNYAFKI